MPGTLIARPVAKPVAGTIGRSVGDAPYHTGVSLLSGAQAPSAITGLISWLQPSASRAAKTMGSRSFDGVNQTFSVASNSNLAVAATDSFTWSAFVYMDSIGADRIFITKGSSGAAADYSYKLYYQHSSTSFRFDVSDGSTEASATVSGVTPAAARWYHLTGVHDAANDVVYLWVDMVRGSSVAHTTGAQAETDILYFGVLGGGAANFHTGDMAQVYFKKAVLASEEIDFLFNDGQGRSASEINDHATLGTNVDIWPLNESAAADNAASKTGNNDLTANNSPGVADGPSIINAADSSWGGYDTARDYDGINQSHTLADNAATSVDGTSFTLGVWVEMDSLAATDQGIVAKIDRDGTGEFSLAHNNTPDQFVFTVNTGSTSSVNAVTPKALETGRFYFVLCEYDSSAQTISIRVDNGEARTATASGSIAASSKAFTVGNYSDLFAGSYCNGRIGSVFLYKRTFTASERDFVWNSGRGRTDEELNFHSTLGPFGEGTAVDMWMQSQTSGASTSYTGNNDLTANNAPTSGTGPGHDANIGTLTNFTAGGGQYSTDTAHDTFDPTAEDTSDNNNHGQMNHDHLEVWDKSGNGNTGTLNGVTDGTAFRISSVPTGASGKAGRFDGVDDYVNVLDDTTLQPGASADWSVSLWLRHTGSQNATAVAKRQNSGAFEQYSIGISGASDFSGSGTQLAAIFREAAGAERRSITDATVSTNEWHHCVMVADQTADEILLYVDGVLQATTTANTGAWPTVNNADALTIGFNNGSNYFSGDIDDLRIFSKALIAKQVKFLHQSHTGTPDEPLNDPGPPDVGWWDFEDSPRNTQNDTPYAIIDENATTNNFGRPIGFKVADPRVQDVPAVLKDESSNENVGRFVGFTEADPRSTKTVALTEDNSSNTNHLRMIGFDGLLDPTVPPVEGASGTGVRLDGTDDALTAGRQQSVLESVAAYSIAGWFKQDVLDVDEGLWGKSSGGTGQMALTFTDGRFYFQPDFSNTNRGYIADYSDFVSAGCWHHVVMVYDGSGVANADRLKVYIDGVAVTLTFQGTIPATTSTNSANFTLGAENSSNRFWTGAVDEFILYDDALTANEALYLYKNFRGEPLSTGTDPGTGNRVGYWPLDTATPRCIEFDGTDDVVRMANSTDFDFGLAGAFTLAGWFNADSFAAAASLISSLDTDGWDLRITNSTTFTLDDGSTAATRAVSAMSTNRWYHVAVTRPASATSPTLYLDGVSQGAFSANPTVSSDSNDLSLGATTAGAQYFNGLLEDFRVYKDAELTAANILALMNDRRTTAGGTATTETLTSQWKGENLLAASGRAITFDGTDDYFECGTSPFSTASSTQAAVSFWSNIVSADFNGTVVAALDTATGDASTNDGFYIQFDDRGGAGQATDGLLIAFATATTSERKVTFDNVLGTLGGWNHYLVAYDSTNFIRLWVNGVAQTVSSTVTSGTGNFVPRAANLTIGAENDGSLYFPAGLDEIAFYDDADVSQANAQYLHDIHLGLTGGTAPTATRRAHYTFDSLSNTQTRLAADSSGNGYDATIINKDYGSALVDTVVTGGTGKSLSNALDEYAILDDHVAGLELARFGTLEVWFETSSSGNPQILFSATDRADSNSDMTLKLSVAGVLQFIVQDAGSAVLDLTASTGLNDGSEHQIVIAVSESGNAVYVDGISVTPTYATGSSSTRAWFSDVSDIDAIRIGTQVVSDLLVSQYFEGSIDDLRITNNYQYSATNVAYRYAVHRGQSTSDTQPSTDPTLNLSFDALTAEDNGKALYFNGTDNHVLVKASGLLNNQWGSGGTVEAWIKPYSDGESSQARIAHKSNGTRGWYLRLQNEASGACEMLFYVYFSGTDGQWSLTSADIRIGEWNHIVVTYDSDAVGNNPTFYINGVVKTVGSGITEDATPVGTFDLDTNDDLYIGNDNGGTSTFDGLIDGFELYTESITANEAAFAYANGLRQHGGASAVNAGADGMTLKMGFDRANDRSRTDLRDGLSIDFDGTDDFINFGATGETVKTVAFWGKFDDVTTKKLLNIDGTDHLELDGSGNVTATSFPAATVYVDGFVTAGPLATGTWYFIAVTDSTGVSASTLELGRLAGTDEADGLFDDFRAYREELSAADIYNLYIGTAISEDPVVLAKLDDGANPAGLDADPINCLRGQSDNNHLFTQATAANRPTLELDEANEKSALSFDGTNDYLQRGEAIKDPYYAIYAIKTGSSFSGDHVVESISDTATLTKFYVPLNITSAGLVQIIWNNGATDTKITAAGKTLSANTAYIVEVWAADGKWHVRIDGQEQALTETSNTNVGLVNPDDADVTTLGALERTSVGSYYNGMLLDRALFNQVPTVANRTAVRRYFANRYDITLVS